MSLKMKLGATISAFFLILGLMVMGVFASSTAKIELGGNLSFTATNVHAKVDGAISGAETNPTLETLEFKEGRTSTEQTAFDNAYKTWTDCDLTFKSTGDAVSIVITIQNLADRPLYATISPAITMSTDVESSMLTVASTTATTGETYNADDLITIDNLDTAYVRLTMTLKNKNATVDSEWGYDISLKDKAGLLTAKEWNEKTDGTALDFETQTVEGKRIAKVRGVRDDEGQWTNYGEISIPSHVLDNEGNIYTVTAVGDYAFGDYDNDFSAHQVTKVTLPNTITSIENSAFYMCHELEEINFPINLVNIGECAFVECGELTGELILPSSVRTIGLGAFNSSGYTGKLVIPEGVETIEVEAFCATNITSVIIPNTATSIGHYAFSGCPELSEITIPASVESIGEEAFVDCENLKTVKIKATTPPTLGSNAIPSNVTAIFVPVGTYEDYIIADGWSDYADIIMVESNVEGILTTSQWKAKTDGTALDFELDTANNIAATKGIRNEDGEYLNYGEIEIPSHVLDNEGNIYTVTAVGDYAFGDPDDYVVGASNVTSITMPSTIKEIGYSAFWYCRGLDSIVIPDSVESIGNYAFEECSQLASVTIGDGVASIGSYAFSHCSGLTEIEIPDSVTSIGEDAFSDCSGLTNVTIGNGVTSIGNSAFSGCSGLASITIEVGNRVYEDRGLNAIVEKETNTIILGCKNTTIDNTITAIGDAAFYGCSGLSEITIPDSVTSIAHSAFYGCTNLVWTDTSGVEYLKAKNSAGVLNEYFAVVDSNMDTTRGAYSIPNGCKFILDSAFSNCSELTSIIIPKSVTSIGDYAFENCSRLTGTIDLSNVTSIGDFAFRHCSRLTSVTIGRNVTSIGNNAFLGCTGLATMTVKATTPPTLGSALPTSITKIYVPTGSKSAYTSATYWKNFNASVFEEKDFE